jgi:hypothetical protein
MRANCQFRIPKSVTHVSQQDGCVYDKARPYKQEFIKKSTADSLTIKRYYKKEQLQNP